jgi:hypothetical protein
MARNKRKRLSLELETLTRLTGDQLHGVAGGGGSGGSCLGFGCNNISVRCSGDTTCRGGVAPV